MLSWIIIVLLLVLGSVVLKFEHHGRKILLSIAIIIGVLLYFSIMAIMNSSEVDLNTPSGVVKGIYIWAGWLGNSFVELFDVGKNAVAGIGNVINQVNSTKPENAFDGRR
jgi:hypothetical protein